ncbi:MAG: diacylglycerol kinase family protein [Candidatus Saccharibacteria bacterium]|nr:diacylglycerol kinase family protein [Candidatus Saccharibacteria bacterium]
MEKEVEYILSRARRAERLVFVWNPRSSKALRVKKEAYEPIFEALSKKFYSFEIAKAPVPENVKRLNAVLKDGDVVIVAGGDGTALVGLNSVVETGKNVQFYALPFGNFNDMPRTLKRHRQGTIKPIEALVNGSHYQYAACYFTMGMMAEATEIFDSPVVRGKLKEGGKSRPVFSVLQLAKWYFRNKHRQFIMPVEIDGKFYKKGLSDAMAVNGASVAKMIKGGDMASTDEFIAVKGQLTSFVRLCVFMARGILFRVPGVKDTSMKFKFSRPTVVEIQAEGEYKRVEDVNTVEFRKVNKEVKVL